MTAVHIKNVCQWFPNLPSPTLQNINLQLEQGEFCVVIGPNGCGKSTLLKLLSGEYKPTSGTVHTTGGVAQVVQDTNLGTIPTMTLLENIALSLTQKPRFLFYKRYQKDIVHLVQDLHMDLEKYLHVPLETLSGGQRQAIATLMAFACQRPILLLDEHTSALDPHRQALLMEYTVRKRKEYNLTTLMVTHNMMDAIRYGHRLVLLHQGKIVWEVAGEEKQQLSVEDVLTRFHHYEDETLLARGRTP